MARNEEKQLGKLNRLWLQKEREEGRLKDVLKTRPKLSTLNTAATVKKWIPSIKKEIEYYLQQSQLTHYPERKIAEFQLHIEALEKEYKSFAAKLRALDPSCKHKPWTPRAYSKRRTEQQDLQNVAKKPYSTSLEESCEFSEDANRVTSSWCDFRKTSTAETLESQCENRTISQVPKQTVAITPDSVNQDLPLSFDQTRLAVAVASFRGSSAALGLCQTNNLARVLQSGLPNLGNSVIITSKHLDLSEKNQKLIPESAKSDNVKYPIQESKCDMSENDTELSTGLPTKKEGHLLGLDYYSSSDDEEKS